MLNAVLNRNESQHGSIGGTQFRKNLKSRAWAVRITDQRQPKQAAIPTEDAGRKIPLGGLNPSSTNSIFSRALLYVREAANTIA